MTSDLIFILLALLTVVPAIWVVFSPNIVHAGFALLFTLFGAAGLFLIGLMGLWDAAMDTLSQVLVATLFALLMGIPLGIWAARNDRVRAPLRPILDFLQTIPAFVYLVPVIMLFNVGRVPGIMASVLYAIPPVIRLTDLGIRRVAAETVEAAVAFGATPRHSAATPSARTMRTPPRVISAMSPSSR